MSFTSNCLIVRSKNVKSSRTVIELFGPKHPIDVPKPPFNFTTINLFKLDFILLKSTSWITLL